jgi:hypothetical protein
MKNKDFHCFTNSSSCVIFERNISMTTRADPLSRLKVLRAVVALERFTSGRVGQWAGLQRSQVMPQLARLRREGIIEYDPNAPRPDGPRPAHRPIRHYLFTRNADVRTKVHQSIREARTEIGEDGASAYRLGVLDGQLQAIGGVLTSSRTRSVSDVERADFERRLLTITQSLDEASLEFDIENTAVAQRLHELRIRLDAARLALEDLPTTAPVRPASAASAVSVAEEEPSTVRVAHWLAEFLRRPHDSLELLLRPWTVDEVPPAFVNAIHQMYRILMIKAPSYSSHARVDYAVCRAVASQVPNAELLFGVTDHLSKSAPDEHRTIYRLNCADLLAWMGLSEKAYEVWLGCAPERRESAARLRVSIAGLVAPERISASIWERLECRVQKAERIMSLAARDALPSTGLREQRPASALGDPFYSAVETSIGGRSHGYIVYGAGFHDLYRNQVGLSYVRLANMLVTLGLPKVQAWRASREVDAGKALVIVGEAASTTSSSSDDVRDLLTTELEAELLEVSSVASA